MRKKKIFSVPTPNAVSATLLFLGAVLLTAPLTAAGEGDTEPAPAMSPLSVNPAQGIQLPSTDGFSRLEVSYKSTGDMGLESVNREGRELLLLKDGKDLLSLPCTRENVFISPNDPAAIIVLIPLQTAPGSYTLRLPEGLVTNSQPQKQNETDEDVPLYQLTSAAYNYGFTIVDALPFQMSPIPGGYKSGELDKITVVYPEGVTLTVNSSARPSMTHINSVPTETGITTTRNIATYYDVEASGNVLTLTAASPSGLKVCTQSEQLEYYALSIPAGAWVATSDGRDYPMHAASYSKYTVRESASASGINVFPAPDDSRVFYPEDFRSFTVSYPEGWSPNVAVGASVGYLKQAGLTKPSGTSGFMFGTLKLAEVNESLRTMTLKLSDPNGYSNNLELMQTGWYFISLNMRVFNTGSGTSAAINMDPYYVDGKDVLYANASVYTGNKWTATDVVDGEVGFSGVGIAFPMNVSLEREDAEISLCRGTEIIKSVSAGECVASNTLTANNQKTGKEWYYKFDSIISEPGNYYFRIPAGTFHQTSWGDFYNTDQDIEISIPSDISYTVFPSGEYNSPYVSEGPLTALTFTYDAGVETALVDGGDPSKVTLSFYEGTVLRHSIAASELTAGDNTVTAVFPADKWLACGNNNTYRLNVGGGAWSVIDGAESTPNTPFESTANTGAHYRGNYVVPGTLTPPAGGEVTVDQLRSLSYTSPVQPLNPSFPGYIGNYPYLRLKGETESLVQYSLTRDGDSSYSFNLTAPGIPEGALCNGDVVEVVIPSPSRVNYLYALGNAQEMVFEYTVSGISEVLPGEFGYTVTPDSSTEISPSDPDSLKEIAITFDEEFTVKPAALGDMVYFANPDGEHLEFLKAPLFSGSTITFYPNVGNVLEEGTYVFSVSQDAVMLMKGDADAGFFQGCEIRYTVKEEETVKLPYTLVPDPEVVLEDTNPLRSVKVTFDDAESITVNSMNLINTANLRLPDGSTFGMGSNRSVVSGNSITVPFPSANFPTSEGEYVFTIFANKVRLNFADGTSANLPATSFTYLVNKAIATGVEEIDLEDGEVEWFDLQGNRIQGLPHRGIHIRIEKGKASKVMVH